MSIKQFFLISATPNVHMLLTYVIAVNDCGIPDGIAVGSGSVTYSGTTFGEIADYRCDSGYVISGDSIRRCQVDSSWSGTTPSCILQSKIVNLI